MSMRNPDRSRSTTIISAGLAAVVTYVAMNSGISYAERHQSAAEQAERVQPLMQVMAAAAIADYHKDRQDWERIDAPNGDTTMISHVSKNDEGGESVVFFKMKKAPDAELDPKSATDMRFAENPTGAENDEGYWLQIGNDVFLDGSDTWVAHAEFGQKGSTDEHTSAWYSNNPDFRTLSPRQFGAFAEQARQELNDSMQTGNDLHPEYVEPTFALQLGKIGL